ncbi:MAG TPA: site-2 protease family protein [Candidatus Magasanikbacteria bacterium]|uniref:Peptidase, M50 family n=1 Tax=Candidatus Magasanikbacteria bacterium GW2011_GWC2_41_17 TaxID=1619048 RepID=A0A0G0XR51_9BACT|nr:MAG: Peptidase, M50 family [Candidatus Magasanikbacteria bacterium GW2011_GWC2_41_17]HBV58003.1 site-2 protease family protein [Candidatus Magasanikbacteria bacterium]HBX16313.1 site-2 protease family protein [Candidatus Magasanikbacteria bacterium]
MDFFSLIFYFIIIIPSAIIHEYAHGWMAWMLGDPTAKYAGRLSLDPRVHIDKWGTILLPIFLYFISGGSFVFAYAKPVPYNPYNLKNQKWGPAMVGLAGPAANIATALIFSIFIRAVGIPSSSFIFSIISFFTLIVYANIVLAIFNLMPIPPLDGSKILYAVLPDSAYKVREFLERYSIFLLFFFIFFAFRLISPVIEAVFRMMVGS